MLLMKEEEAFSAAEAELFPRRAQMTTAEYVDAVLDRARQLMGLVPLARLKKGRRPSAKELEQLTAGIDMMLDDYGHVVRFGEARVRPDGWVTILFRLSERPDIPLILTVNRADYETWHAIGASAGVKAYDALDPTRVKDIIKDFPPERK